MDHSTAGSLNWIKPSEIPHKYWGPAWVCARWFKDQVHVPVTRMIRQEWKDYYDDIQEHWQPLYDEHHRIMIIPQPDHTNAFKEA